MPMSRRTLIALAAATGLAALGGAWAWRRPRPASADLVARAYGPKLPPVEGPLRVYHLGHSLVGRDMPAMLAQLAPEGHDYATQTGAGTSLWEHWDPEVPIRAFEEANDHPRFRPAREAVASGDYDAVVLTEMVELKDAIRYHDTPRYLHLWADLARAAGPRTQVYLYETWHPLDDPEGWLERIDRDLPALWEGRIVDADLRAAGPDRPVRVIPGGQVMAAFARRVEAMGGIEGIAGREDLFARKPDGTLDRIHYGDLGAYLLALTHYAVLYRRSPLGLPHALLRADDTPATAPTPAAARLMQEVVWTTVTGYRRTGVAA
jgi:hypothetical protein